MPDSQDPRSRYAPIRQLGQGGMGRVLLVEDQQLGREVALKEITVLPEHMDVLLSRFMREARVLAQVRHPHLVELYDVAPEATPPFLVLEYVEGRELFQAIPRGEGLAPALAERVVRELSGALEALHAAGVVHRDIKSRNVLLRSRDGSAVLMDMGLALELERTRITETGGILGTPRYFPPEMIRGEALGPAADWYQLGVLLFECVTGEALVPGDSWPELQANLLSGKANPIPADVPGPLARAIHRLTDPVPATRLTSREELLRILEPRPTRPARKPEPPGALPPQFRILPLLGLLLVGFLLGRLGSAGPAAPPEQLQPALSSPLESVQRLLPGRRLEVRVGRACRLRFEASPDRWAHLSAGTHALAVPERLAGDWNLELREGARVSRVPLDARALVDRLARSSRDGAEARHAWLEDALAAPISASVRRAFWEVRQRDRLEELRRIRRGGPPAGLPPTPSRLGVERYLSEPSPAKTVRTLELRSPRPPVEGGQLVLITRASTLVPNPDYKPAATRIELTWPEDAPGDETPVALELWTERLPEQFGFQFRTIGPEGELPVVTLWHPRPDDPESRSQKNWIHLTLPGALWPAAGTPMSLALVALEPPADNFARLREVRVSWGVLRFPDP